ncbi:MAG: hypothetical protein ACYDIA_04685, partial [Candidatus Humimicrobiaceae bacterium]
AGKKGRQQESIKDTKNLANKAIILNKDPNIFTNLAAISFFFLIIIIFILLALFFLIFNDLISIKISLFFIIFVLIFIISASVYVVKSKIFK